MEKVKKNLRINPSFFSKIPILLVIFTLAAFLRLWHLADLPGGFDADEAAFGYNGYSLLLTGRDEYGKFLPVTMKSFGEYKPALYAYLTIPGIIIFDLTPLATRLPSAVFGILTVYVLYLLTRKLTQNRQTALTASLLLAISPWHINLSRTTSEVVLALFFILFMLWGLMVYQESERKRWIYIAFLSGLLAIFSYTAASFFVILLTAIFALYTTKHKTAFTLLATFLLTAGLFSSLGTINRFKQINIFQHPLTKLVMEEQIREDQFGYVLATRFFHNKVINTGRTILQNYAQYFTADYLVLNGGFPYRQKVPSTGLFYIWEIFFLLAGVYYLLHDKQKSAWLLLPWWLVLLIPSAITFDEVPNVYRSLIVLPAMVIIIAFGLREVFRRDFYFKKIFLCAVAFFACWEFLYYQHQYLVHQQVHQPWHRGYAYKELASAVKNVENKYNKLIITKANASPYIYLLFYNKYDPRVYQKEGSPRDLDFQGFSKYTFVPFDCPFNESKITGVDDKKRKDVLYINKGACSVPASHAAVLKTINWQDNSPAFTLLKYTGSSSAEKKGDE